MTADERHRALAAGDELLSQRRHRETLGRVFQEIDGRNTWSEFDGSIDAATEGLSAGEANEIRAAASERFARERHRTNVERILSRIDSENLSDEAFDRAVGEAIEAGQMDPTEAAAATRAAYRDVSGIESWPPPDEGNE